MVREEVFHGLRDARRVEVEVGLQAMYKALALNSSRKNECTFRVDLLNL